MLGRRQQQQLGLFTNRCAQTAFTAADNSSTTADRGSLTRAALQAAAAAHRCCCCCSLLLLLSPQWRLGAVHGFAAVAEAGTACMLEGGVEEASADGTEARRGALLCTAPAAAAAAAAAIASNAAMWPAAFASPSRC